MWVLNKQQKGDTIVEVLIALAIIGAVIAGAYATATRSIRLTQQSQERTRATKLAEQQLEAIRSIASSGDANSQIIYGSSDGFCVANPDAGSSDTVAQFDASATIPQNEQDAILTSGDPDGNYPAACLYDDFYHVHVAKSDTVDRFTVTVRWERLGGGIDQIRVVYGINSRDG